MVNDEEPVQEAAIETIIEVKPVVNTRSKAKAKPKIKYRNN